MDEAQILIDEHYAQMNSNRSSYEIVPLDSEEIKRITEYNKARRPELYNDGQCYNWHVVVFIIKQGNSKAFVQ